MAPDWYLKSKYPVYLPMDELMFVSDEAFKIAVIANPSIIADTPPCEIDETDDCSMFLDQWKHRVLHKRQKQLSEEVEYQPKRPKQRTSETDQPINTALSRLFGTQPARSLRWMRLLPEAWEEDPKKTLAVLAYSRSPQFGGGNREYFYHACGWLYRKHPKTFLEFIKLIPEPLVERVLPGDIHGAPEKGGRYNGRLSVTDGVPFGSWKDLLALLLLAVNGTFYEARANWRQTIAPHVRRQRAPYTEYVYDFDYDSETDVALADMAMLHNVQEDEAFSIPEADYPTFMPDGPPSYVPHEDSDYGSENEDLPRLPKAQMRPFRHERAVYRFQKDPVYRAFHITVARMFAGQLKKDLEALEQAEKKGAKPVISHCAKWAPSHGRAHDKSTFIVSSIAEIMFPETLFTEELVKAGLTEMTEPRRTRYLWLARLKYASVLTKLRKVSEDLPSALNRVEDRKVDYSSVPASTMLALCYRFSENDPKRFHSYLNAVNAGTETMSIDNITPGQLMATAYRGIELQREVAGIQWKLLVKKVRAKRRDELALVICCTSRNQFSPIIKGCPNIFHTIGLMALMLDCMDNSWHDQILKCSPIPEWVDAPREDKLLDRFCILSGIVGMGRFKFPMLYEDFILPRLIRAKSAGEPLPTKIIFLAAWSLLDIDSPTTTVDPIESEPSRWIAAYEGLRTRFAEHGLEVPKMVYWYLWREQKFYEPPDMFYPEGVTHLFDGGLDCTKAYIEGEDFEKLARRRLEIKDGTWVAEGDEIMTPVKLMERGLANEAFRGFEVYD